MAKEAKHTPAPWTVKNDYDERHIVIANIDGESFPDGTTSYTYDFVCDTYGDGDDGSRSMTVAIANARLIAAAPDLLEAVKDARAMLAMVEVIDGEDGDPWSKALARMDAALAKAEARS